MFSQNCYRFKKIDIKISNLHNSQTKQVVSSSYWLTCSNMLYLSFISVGIVFGLAFKNRQCYVVGLTFTELATLSLSFGIIFGLTFS